MQLRHPLFHHTTVLHSIKIDTAGRNQCLMCTRCVCHRQLATAESCAAATNPWQRKLIRLRYSRERLLCRLINVCFFSVPALSLQLRGLRRSLHLKSIFADVSHASPARLLQMRLLSRSKWLSGARRGRRRAWRLSKARRSSGACNRPGGAALPLRCHIMPQQGLTHKARFGKRSSRNGGRKAAETSRFSAVASSTSIHAAGGAGKRWQRVGARNRANWHRRHLGLIACGAAGGTMSEWRREIRCWRK